MRNKKYDYMRGIRQYVFDEKCYNGYIPVPDGDLIERAAYALYMECPAVEYASVDLAEDGSVLVSNFKEDYEVHLNTTDNGGVKVIAKINRFYGKAQVQRTFKTEDDATADAIRYLVWLAAQKFTTRDNDSVTHINRSDGIPSTINRDGDSVSVTSTQKNAIEAIWSTFPSVDDLFIEFAYCSPKSVNISGHRVSCDVLSESLVRTYVNHYGRDQYSVDSSDGSTESIEKAFKDAMEIENYIHTGSEN